MNALLRLVKHGRSDTPSAPAASSDAATAASSALPASLPDFAAALPLLSARRASQGANGVFWRGADGFAALGKYLTQLLNCIIAAEPAGARPPFPLLAASTHALQVLTDREAGRKFLSEKAHAPSLVGVALDALSSPRSASLVAASQNELESHQLVCSNLIANLAHHADFRAWLTGSEQTQERMLDPILEAVAQQIPRCALTSSKVPSFATAASPAVLNSSLSILLNLLQDMSCRLRLVHQQSASLDSLLKGLQSVAEGWERVKFQLIPGSTQAEVSDKLLSIVLNLSVDSVANAIVFNILALPGAPVLPLLLRLAAQPAIESQHDAPASAESVAPCRLHCSSSALLESHTK